MSTFGSGSTTTAGASITLRSFSGTDGLTAGTDGLVPGPSIAQQGYILGASGDWVLTIKAIDDLNESSTRIATTNFVQTLIGQAQLGGGNANLSALGDVSFADLATGQFLQYNTNGDNNWSNITLTVGTISDVNLAGLQDGNALVYSANANGGEGGWIAGEGGGGGAANLTGLSDVNIGGEGGNALADKQFLVYNGVDNFVNRAISSADLSNSADIILRDGSVAFTGDVNVIEHDLSVGTITIKDNANTFIIKSQDGASPNYITFNTTNALELITFEKNTAFNQRVDFANTVVINEAGNGVDFRVETGTKTHAIFTSGVNDRVGIFQDNPTVALDVVGDTKIDGALEVTGNITAANLGTASANNAGDFLASDASIGDLPDVDLTGVGFNVGDGRVLIWDADAGGVGRFITGVPAATYTNEEARDAAGGALADGGHTGISFVNNDDNNTIDATVDITGFSVGALSDVNIGVLAQGNIGQVLKVTAKNGGGHEFTLANETDTNTQRTDPEIQTVVGAMVTNNTETGITVTAQNDGTIDFEVGGLVDAQIGAGANISVDKLASKAISLGSSTLNLGGGAITSIAGMTSIDFTNANATIGASMTTTNDDQDPPQAVSTTLTLGGVGSTVVVAGALQSTGLANLNGGIEITNGPNNVFTVSDAGAVVSVGGITDTTTVSSFKTGTTIGNLTLANGSITDSGGAISFGDENLSTTGTLTVPTISLTDNNTTSLVIKTADDNAPYLTFNTLNDPEDGSPFEQVEFGKIFTAIAGSKIGNIQISNGEIITTAEDNNLSFVDNNLSTSGNLTINTNKFVVAGATGNTTIGGELSLSNGNITNVGDISLDTISSASDGTTVKVLMDDEVAGAFEVRTTRNAVVEPFIKVDTTDGAEKITIGNGNENIVVALDLTNAITTVKAPTEATHAATKAYVDAEMQAAGNVTQLTNLSDVTIGVVQEDDGQGGQVNVGVAEAVGQVLRLSTLVEGDATYKNEALDLDDLSNITLGVVNGAGVAKAEGQVLRLSADDSTFVNAQLAASDLSGTTATGLSVLNAADQGAARTAISAQASNARLDDIAGLANTADNFIVGDGANLTLKTPTQAITSLGMGVAQNQILIGAAAANTFNTIATTANGRSFLASEAGINDLSDVVITGADVPANLDAHILVFDGDDQGGDNDKFKNVALSGDITITNAGLATIAADAILTDKIKNGEVTNAKLANSYATISDGTNSDNLELGETFTIKGVANETTVTLTEDDVPGGGFGQANVEITVGLAENVVITGNLTVQGTTTTINTATLDVEDTIIRLNKGVMDLNGGAGGVNTNDIGLFFERGLDDQDVAVSDGIFYWDEGDDFFKLGLTTNNNHEATDFGATTTPGGLQIGSLELRDDNATSLVIQEGGNAYLTFNTLDADPGDGSGFEQVEFGKIFKAITGSKIGNLTLADGSITDSSGAISFGDENLSTTGSLGAGATTVTSLSVTEGNITNVGDISLDTISADGTTIQVLMDNLVASAFEVKVPVENDDDITYFKVDTSDGEELITFEKNVVFNGTTNISANFDQAITINGSGNDADFMVKGQIDNGVVPTVLATDAANKRVGVGTATPSTTLHVVGDTTIEGAITHNSGAVAFNSDAEDFDFKVSGVGEANLLFVDSSAASIGIGKNNPSKTLDITGSLGVSSTTTLANDLEITTGATNGITFRSDVENNEADGNATLLRVNIGANGADPAPNNPVYKKIHWVAATDDFSVESGLISEGDFTVGADQLTVNASNGNTAIAGTLGVSGTTTINSADGSAQLIAQKNGIDVFKVDPSDGTTTITGTASVSSQLKTDDLRGRTAGTGNFHIRLEDNIANALEILDATNDLPFMVFTTTDDSESITLSQDAIFKKAISIESTNTNGLFFNTDKSGEGSADATLITIERGTDAGTDVVLAWDTTDHALNLNPMAQMHLQGRAGANALTIGGALVANATIVMTTAGAITLDGTLDSPTINTDKITDKTGDGLVIELADNDTDALLIRQGAAGENYITLSSENGDNNTSQKITLHQKTTVSNTLAVSMQTTLGGILNLKSNLDQNGDVANPLIKANSDRIANGAEASATLIEVERGELANAKFKWDETSNCFEFDQILSAEGNFQVGSDAANPELTINSGSGDLSTSGEITTSSIVNFTTASQGAIVFNSDLGDGVAPANDDDFGLTVNRGNTTDAKLYWDEGETSWKFETGSVKVQNSLEVDSDAGGKITISTGSITSASGAISFGDENLTTTGTIDAATPAGRDAENGLDDSTQVATTAWVLDLRLGDFDQVDTTAFDTSGQVLVWNQEQSKFEKGASIYGEEDARDDVGAALVKGSVIDGVKNDVNGGSTGADTISFTLDDANDIINLALGISSGNLTDISTDAPANNQVLRFTTAEGGNQNKYVPTTLGTAADVDTGLSNGNIPTLTTHTWSTKTNEVADLIITGRYIEAIDYGLVTEAFDADTDWALDFGSVADSGISSWEDYGQLVV